MQVRNDAGVKIAVSATFRPPERAYLMYWSWKLSRGLVKPTDIPAKSGVDIDWVHKTADGKMDKIKSTNAAKDRKRAFGMKNLHVAPALNSRHTQGNTIDMTLSWSGTLTIKNSNGERVVIENLPRDGMNKRLHEAGKKLVS